MKIIIRNKIFKINPTYATQIFSERHSIFFTIYLIEDEKGNVFRSRSMDEYPLTYAYKQKAIKVKNLYKINVININYDNIRGNSPIFFKRILEIRDLTSNKKLAKALFELHPDCCGELMINLDKESLQNEKITPEFLYKIFINLFGGGGNNISYFGSKDKRGVFFTKNELIFLKRNNFIQLNESYYVKSININIQDKQDLSL